MKTKLYKFMGCFCVVLVSTSLIATNPVLIKGYSSKKNPENQEVKINAYHKTKQVSTATTNITQTETQPRPKQVSTVILNKTQTESQPVVTPNTSDKIIFHESFSSESLDNNWVEDSGTKNMVAVVEPHSSNKFLKINSQRPNGNSFIQIDLTNQLRGKKLKLCGKIKMENVKMGSQPYETGQLALKYLVNNNKWVYVAVQYLTGSSDWEEYCAHEDGSTEIDNTDRGPYYFYVPENAKNAILYLGLQNCTGTIYFKDITITEVN